MRQPVVTQRQGCQRSRKKIVQGYHDPNDVLFKNLSVLDEWLGRNAVREGWRPLLYLDISDVFLSYLVREIVF